MNAIARRGRGMSQATRDLIEAAAEILEEIQPATVRAVCYRLFVAGLIPSMAKANTNRVSRTLVAARERGRIPWEWIVDETREAERVAAWRDPEAIIGAAVSQYRKDYWTAQPRWVEVWSEKGTVRGTLATVLRAYGVTFRVMHGYGSATALQAIASETERNPKPLTALYVGDWDPSGLHMSEADLPDRLTRYKGAVALRRVALTDADTRNGNLPYFEAATKAKDPRHAWFVRRYGARCWELDALPPPELRRRVEAEILTLLDLDAWGHAKKVEAVEVASMREILGVWRQSISMPASECLDGRGDRP
jgi:hypothetical protein